MSTAIATRPVKILQFGEGNFLRCFIDWMVQKANANCAFNAGVTIVQPIGDSLTPPSLALNARNGRYHACLRGVSNGATVEDIEEIDCVQNVLCAATQWQDVEAIAASDSLRFVVSNTTEAGIEYRKDSDTFPRKCALLLRARFRAGKPGLVFLPCELIEHNGDALKSCILQYAQDWNDAPLAQWIESECVFCSTLVDRIVSGRPDEPSRLRYAERLGEDDPVLVCGEPFHLLVIETPKEKTAAGFDFEKEFPLARAGINVVYTPDMSPYRTRKVRFLNGAHTSSVLKGHLLGFSTVHDLTANPAPRAELESILFEEILPTVNLPDAEKREYANSVLERFSNPYANHRLLSIALNSVSKWKVRVLPTILDYVRLRGTPPPLLSASLAWLVRFYRTGAANDAPAILAYFKSNPSCPDILSRQDFWGMDLNTIPGFTALVQSSLA